MTYQDTYKQWLNSVDDDKLREELEAIKDDDNEIKERFLNDLPFGTAGLRGIIGAGIARMNTYTVARATQGLSYYLKSTGNAENGMVIAYDSRLYSREFAEETACVFAGNGIKTRLFKQLTSVPELSFAVRYFKADGGIVITASHNPMAYNGYKVYASYGGQLGPEESLAVTACIQKVDAFSGIKKASLEEGIKSGLIEEIGEEIDARYYEKLLTLCDKDEAKNLKVVYTPLHGSGLRSVMNVLPAAGITNLTVVEEQREPDGRFPTIKSPNPEDAGAMKMAIELAKKTDADLAFGTDPDADRMGAAVRDQDGSYRMLTGNQIACILIEYLLEKRKQDGCLKPTDYIIKSFVSTTMADAIAKHYGIVCHIVLTGFRFISEIITQNENTGAEFIFGFEESYGFLAGTFTRDKDGVLGALLLCKAAQHYQAQGKSLLEVLSSLYERYGFYAEGIKNMVFEGLDGMEKMKAIMTSLRDKPISEIGGIKVLVTEDYQSGLRTDAEGKKEALTLPKSNALRFLLEDGAWACIRPSGTEPKIKAYFAARAQKKEEAQSKLKDIAVYFDGLI